MEEVSQLISSPLKNSQKLLFFISRTDNSKPTIPSQQIPIHQLIREYLNDDDFTILRQGKSIFTMEGEMDRIDRMYEEWKVRASNSSDINGFLGYWIKQSPNLTVSYSLFDDIQNENEFSFGKSVALQRQQPFQAKSYFQRQGKGNNTKQGKNEFSRKGKKEQSSKQLLRRFFIFYAKKQVKSNSIQSFVKYQRQSNSLNLTKFTRYCRDVGLSSFRKILTLERIKQIFTKHQDSNKLLNWQKFETSVQQLLNILFENNQEKVKQLGYSLIGIQNQDNFEKKFASLGEIPPNYSLNKPKLKFITNKKSVKQKVENSVRLDTPADCGSTLQSASPTQQIHSFCLPKVKMAKLNTISNQPGITNNSTSNVFKNWGQGCVGNRKVMKEREQFLSWLMKEGEGDPYLERYTDKQNAGRYRCIANRIDERIQKIHQKYQ